MRPSGSDGETREDEEPPTELCLGTDGILYVNAEGVDPEKIQGRKMFHGYAMTPEERTIAVVEIHRLAFNITVSVQGEIRQRLLRKSRRQKKQKGR